MSKYKVGDKVLIEGEVVGTDDSQMINTRIAFKDNTEEWFNEQLLFNVTKTYEDGLNDAWELARKTYNLSCNILEEIYGVDGGFYELMKKYTPQEALKILEAYEESKAIKVGDVVYADDETDSFGVVTWKYNNDVYVMWDDGSCGDETNIDELHKTGRHIDIGRILEEIRG